ncbi:4-(cytidine 5'-diphospho)-2-C-methyl-D-erythritol kinase [Planctomicrobium sp. SH664]|uniref:4-(cytidine 5'-diphospho)-2-C-methyl-D-erythritol kinase n=1 Tax=Planctomicrobium sp. SH664 TaxID=3448125 RepID=UPI003F5C0878
MRVTWQGSSLVVRTPAKLNLYLQVVGRRPDGYHDLETLMVSVGLYDTLKFSPTVDAAIRLTCASALASPATIPTDERNLVVRAAQLLARQTGHSQGASIHLTKRIPMEAGMGGGSSDAAATLVGLNQLWNLERTPQQLHALAAQLGSDVNFFLDSPVAAACTGRGEAIVPIELRRPLNFVIVQPSSGLSTARVFQAWQQFGQQCRTDLATVVEAAARPDATAWPQVTDNDLASPARSLNPEMNALLQKLETLPALGCGMTGSGSACFLICHSSRQARTLAGRCRHWNLGQVYLASTGV